MSKAESIKEAIRVLKIPTTQGVSAGVPTAKTTTALNFLTNATLDHLKDRNFKQLAEDLFNWKPEAGNKATKPVIKALAETLQTPNKYSHAVELTAYVAALAPLFQPDRLVRILSAINETDTAYAPNRYTLTLHSKLAKLLSRLPSEERKEKIAYDLWVSSHKGRWWELTAGFLQAEQEVPEIESEEELLALFVSNELIPAYAKQLAKLGDRPEIRQHIKNYLNDLADYKEVDPDVAVIISHLDYLTPAERPENPIPSLLDAVNRILDIDGVRIPSKPRTFAELFPDIRLGGSEYLFPHHIRATEHVKLPSGIQIELIRSKAELYSNSQYFGNCTYSKDSQIQQGTYVLYVAKSETGEPHNLAISTGMDGKAWRLEELKSRFNRAAEQRFKEQLEKWVKTLPAPSSDPTFQLVQQASGQTRHAYKYKLS